MDALSNSNFLHQLHPSTGYDGRTYYGMPAIKRSYYGGKTATAFFLEGIGGSAQVIASIGDLIDRGYYQGLIRAGRVLALTASPVGPMVLTAALHTPRRWYNMLRIFRPTSPMSIGIWTLTKMGVLNSLSLAGTMLENMGYERPGRWMSRVFGSLGAAAGGMVSVYMGPELEETSTPMWMGAFPFLSPLFAATNFANGVAALSLASLIEKDTGEIRAGLEQIGAACTGLQMIFTTLMFRRLYISMGASAVHLRAMAIIWPGIIAPVILRILNARARRGSISMIADATGLAGGFLILASLLFAGRESGRHPEEYLSLTSGNRSIPDVAPGHRAGRIMGTNSTNNTLRWGGIAFAAGLLASLGSQAVYSRIRNRGRGRINDGANPESVGTAGCRTCRC